MLEKIKDNILMILLFIYLLYCAFTALYKYGKEFDSWFKIDQKNYEQCQIDDSNKILCDQYKEPLKKRDTVSTFGYITTNDDKISFLQTLLPLLIMLAGVSNFHKKLKKGYFKNSITRIGYKKSFKKLYLNSLKTILVLPIFFIILFIGSYLISGNFDVEYGIRFYKFDVFGIENCRNWLLFLIIYLTNFMLHAIFWINIGIYNSKHNKSFLVSTIFSYIEYTLLFIITDLFTFYSVFGDSKIPYYLHFMNMWSFNELNIYGVLLVYLMYTLLSTILVFITYKDKEKVLEEI